MSYLVFARKYRPQSFTSVTGQEHVVRTIKNAIKRNRIPHAFLFAGPRGVGKTSLARILAKALNCMKPIDSEPCEECDNCKDITRGNSLAVREIDGASNNSVDDVRDLIDSFRSVPPPGSKYKIYIIDEVHMLSVSAFNALLKSLEEPPRNTIFILATTEVHKIPETVISRCQRHDFKALRYDEIIQRLKHIAEAEGVRAEERALEMVARVADGSMRDSQSLFDRIVSFCEGTITAESAAEILGLAGDGAMVALASAILQGEPATALSILDQAFSRGVDPSLFLSEFANHWRDLLRISCAASASSSDKASQTLLATMSPEKAAQGRSMSVSDAQRFARVYFEGADAALRSSYNIYSLEALVVRMAAFRAVSLGKEPAKREENSTIAQRSSASPGEGKKAASPGGAFKEQTAPPRGTPLARGEAKVLDKPVMVEEDDDFPFSGEVEDLHSSIVTLSTINHTDIDFSEFVKSVTEKGSRMLAEQLKRLIVLSFKNGEFLAEGPDLIISYFRQEDNKAKLLAELQSFTKSKAEWRFEFKSSKGKAGESSKKVVSQSLHAIEEQAREKNTLEKKIDLYNHPKVRTLQKVFPGAQIEKIKLVDE